ncbi:MAG: hypothetical protein ACR2HN_04230 [Tepidiformaceae bacterium]
MKIWELHGLALNGAIVTTADGDADVDGLILSEKAYLLAVRDFRPSLLVDLVRTRGADATAQSLIDHFGGAESLQQSAGRALVATRGLSSHLVLRRSDEVRVPAGAGSHARN